MKKLEILCETTSAYRKGDIYAVTHHDFGEISSDIAEQIGHDVDSFVPYQPNISLREIKGPHSDNGDFARSVHTSEKAGAVTSRNLFHSSLSEGMIFFSYTTVSEESGLGNLA